MEQNRKPGYWAVLPSHVRYDPELKPNAKLLYAEISALANATGYCWATNAHFADLFALSVATVSRLVAQLEERGYIRTEMAPTDTGSERRIYAGIFDIRVRWGGIDENEDTPLRKNVKRGLDENAERGLRKNVKQNNINNNIIPPIPPKGDVCGNARGKRRRTPRENPDWKPDRFAGLWAYYPSAGRKDKQRAMDAWDKLRPNDDLIATIGCALKKLKSSEEWQRGIGIPHVATFLNNARWEDAESLPDGASHEPVTEPVRLGWD